MSDEQPQPEPQRLRDLILTPPGTSIDELYRQKALAEQEAQWEAIGSGGAELVAPTPEQQKAKVEQESQAIVAEPKVTKALDEIHKYKEMRAAEGDEGGVYNADLPFRKGWKDEVTTDPIAGIMKMLADVMRPSSPDIKSGVAPGGQGDVRGLSGALKTAADALRRLRNTGRAAEMVNAAKTTVNLSKVGASGLGPAGEEVKATMGAVGKIAKSTIEAARKPITNEATVEAAKRSGLTMEQAASMDVEKYDMSAMQTALRDFHNAAATHLDDLINRTLTGDQEAGNGLASALALAGELASRDVRLGEIAGQALQSRKIVSQAERAAFSPEGIAEISALLKGMPDGEPILLAQRLAQLRKEERMKFARQVIEGIKADPTWKDLITFAWINNLVSGPITHAANMASNTATLMWAPAERFLAATFDIDAYRGKGRSVFFGEAPAMVWGGLASIADSLRFALKSAKTGQEAAFGASGKLEKTMPWPSQVWGEGAITHALDWIYGIFTLGGSPTRGLMAEDTFYKWGAYRMEIGARAYREAAQEGLQGQDFSRRVRKIMADPPAPIQTMAKQFAMIQTLNAELSDLGNVGKFGQGVSTIREAAGPLGTAVLPFLKTPTNELHFMSERTPLLNLASDTLRADLFGKDSERRALAMGKLAGSGVVAATIAFYGTRPIDPDNPTPYMTNITGAGPRDPAQIARLREQGWQPLSVWDPFDKQYISLARISAGTVMGATMTAIEMVGELPSYEADQVYMAVKMAAGRVIVNKSFLTGLSEWLTSMEGKQPGDSRKFFQSMARSVVPGAVRQFNRAEMDPVMRETFDYMDEVRSGIPGLSQTLPPRRNLWGDPILLGGGLGPDIISPFFTSPVKDDDVTDELIRLKVKISRLPKYIAGSNPNDIQLEADDDLRDGVQLNPDEYDRWAVLTGKGGSAPPNQGHNLGGFTGRPTLKEALEKLMRSANYQERMTDSSRRDEVKKVVRIYKTVALAQLRREYPDLGAAIDGRKRERIRNKMQSTAAAPGPKPTVVDQIQGLLGSLGR